MDLKNMIKQNLFDPIESYNHLVCIVRYKNNMNVAN